MITPGLAVDHYPELHAAQRPLQHVVMPFHQLNCQRTAQGSVNNSNLRPQMKQLFHNVILNNEDVRLNATVVKLNKVRYFFFQLAFHLQSRMGLCKRGNESNSACNEYLWDPGTGIIWMQHSLAGPPKQPRTRWAADYCWELLDKCRRACLSCASIKVKHSEGGFYFV